MSHALNSLGLRELLLAAGKAVEGAESRLIDLDSAIGDGDHGITMRIGFQSIKKTLESLPADSLPGQLLTAGGKAFMGSTGGAIGIILGRALMAAGEALGSVDAVGTPEWKQCFRAMERAVITAGKARPGDKTLLDPLHAVNEALANMGEDTESVVLLSAAADAAEYAAEATSSMRCRMGRASRLGDKALGHPDPGAVSFSIITRAMADRFRVLPSAAFVESH